MSDRVVVTQAELDAALADSSVTWIEIRSAAGVWLEVRTTGSATVHAYGSATVHAYGSATVRAYDSATVRAYGSATVHAYGSATVHAYGSATVHAYGSATVHAYDSATVHATSHVAAHLHSATVQIKGGIHIKHFDLDLTDPKVWCKYHGVKVVKGVAQVFKAVDSNWTTSRRVDYSPGALPTCLDWNPNNDCGGGLHFGPTPTHALAYHEGATKFVRVGIALETLNPILGSTAKCKAPSVITPCVEVDLDGKLVKS